MNSNLFTINSSLFNDDIDPDLNLPLNNSPINCDYYDPDQFNHLVKNSGYLPNSTLSLFHVNSRSLSKNLDNLVTTLSLLSIKFDIVAITETWLNSNSNPHVFNIPGYHFECRSRQGRAGGVALYLNDIFSYNVNDDFSIFEDGCFESLFIEVQVQTNPNLKNIIIGVIYRPPNQNNINKFLEYYERTVSQIVSKGFTCFILGDFNLDLLNKHSEYVQSFLNLNSTYLLYNLIDQPTRIAANSNTLIDNIFTNSIHSNTSGIIIDDISDHLPVFCFSSHKVKPKQTNDEYVTFRCFSPSNFQTFLEQISYVNWSFITDLTDVNTAYNVFIDNFCDIYNTCFPYRCVKKSKHDKSWVTSGIKSSCRTKNKLYKKYIKNQTAENHSDYFRFRNILTKVIRVAKYNYYVDKFDNCNIKETWKVINNLIKGKNSKSSPTQLSNNGITVSDPYSISDIFNNYFVNIGPSLSTNIKPSSFSFKDYLLNPVPHSLFMIPCSEMEVDACISNMKLASPGFDDIHSKVLKVVSVSISKPLSHIINLSFTTGIVPDKIKIGRIVPVFKGGDPDVKSNYRPISVLPCISKIFERLVYNRLLTFINNNDILSPYQFGFLPGRSSAHALVNFVDEISNAFERKMYACGIFLDLSKAFDTLNHDILLYKLNYYGIRGIANKWFTSYLSNRKQYVSCNDVNSSCQSITTGVPQGSILGPLLFLLYINDLYIASDKFLFTLYADDTNILYSNSSLSSLIDNVNCEMPKVLNWFNCNSLHLNSKKSIAMIFHPRQRIVDTTNKGILISDNYIPFSNTTKFLGVIIDKHLTWESHIAIVSSKVSKGVGIIFKLNKVLPIRILVTLYNSLLLPYLNYCNVVWGHACTSYLQKLHILQKRALRAISNSPSIAHSKPLFYKFKLLSIYDIATFHKLFFVYSSLNCLLPVVFSDYFTLSRSLHSYSTRNYLNLKFPLYRLTSNQNNVKFTGAKLWNSLPVDIRNASSPNSFKSRLKIHLLSLYCD